MGFLNGEWGEGLYYSAITDSGGTEIAGHGEVNKDWVELSKRKKVKVIEHIEGKVLGPGRAIHGYAMIALQEQGKEPETIFLWERDCISYLGLHHKGDDFETI